jgi:hypothetical protein
MWRNNFITLFFYNALTLSQFLLHHVKHDYGWDKFFLQKNLNVGAQFIFGLYSILIADEKTAFLDWLIPVNTRGE